MAAKKFTNEEKELLRNNPYVESVENTRVIYTEEFKVFYMKNYLAGKKPTEIFVMAGFDPSVMGSKRIERASARWRKLYADGMLNLDGEAAVQTTSAEEKAQAAETAETVESTEAAKSEDVQSAEEAPKKRRGRPRKNAAAETKSEYEAKSADKPKKPRKKRVNKIALMAQNIKEEQEKAKEVNAAKEADTAEVKAELAKKAAEKTVVEAPKKRRGRPRKNPEAVQSAQPVKTAEKTAETAAEAPKKRRGRPRKNPETVQVQPVKAVEKAAETAVEAPKKRRGRPRKNAQAAVVPSAEPAIAAVKQTAVQASTQDAVIKQLVSALNDLMEEVHLLRGELALSNKK